MEKRIKQPLQPPRQVRFPKDVEEDLQKIADVNGLDFADALRMAAKTGLPILKKRMGVAIKQAA